MHGAQDCRDDGQFSCSQSLLFYRRVTKVSNHKWGERCCLKRQVSEKRGPEQLTARADQELVNHKGVFQVNLARRGTFFFFFGPAKTYWLHTMVQAQGVQHWMRCCHYPQEACGLVDRKPGKQLMAIQPHRSCKKLILWYMCHWSVTPSCPTIPSPYHCHILAIFPHASDIWVSKPGTCTPSNPCFFCDNPSTLWHLRVYHLHFQWVTIPCAICILPTHRSYLEHCEQKRIYLYIFVFPTTAGQMALPSFPVKLLNTIDAQEKSIHSQ